MLQTNKQQKKPERFAITQIVAGLSRRKEREKSSKEERHKVQG